VASRVVPLTGAAGGIGRVMSVAVVAATGMATAADAAATVMAVRTLPKTE